MARTSPGDRHQGRTTTPRHDEPTLRPRSKAVTATAWLLVAGLTLAVVLPVVALIFG